MSSPVDTETAVHSYNILVCNQASRPTTQTLGWMGHEYWLRSSSSAVVLEGNHWSGITLAMHYNCCPTHARTHAVPSVLWRCWLGGRKGIRACKKRVVGCWRGCLSGARCRLACGPADATATHSLSLASVKSRLVLPFWYRLTQVVPEKGPLNGCVCCGPSGSVI